MPPEPKWQNPGEMQKAIDAYFAECAENKDPFTVTGLAMALDLTREGLLHYARKSDAFADTIKRAKIRVENFIEKRLFHANATGSIFNLKNNFGWIDDQNVNLGGQEGNQLPGVSDAHAFAKLRAAGVDPAVLKSAFTPDDDAGKS